VDAKSPTAPRRLTAAERRVQAVKLRQSGASYQQIGATLGITDSAAHKLVKQALADRATQTADGVDALRQLEDMKLDAMELAITKLVSAGNLGAIDRQLRIMDRRAKLHGLDAPTKAVNQNWDMADFSDDELAEIAAGAEPATVKAKRGRT
jgi:hypothetical protein